MRRFKSSISVGIRAQTQHPSRSPTKRSHTVSDPVTWEAIWAKAGLHSQHVQSIVVGGWHSGNGAHPGGSEQAHHLVGKWSHVIFMKLRHQLVHQHIQIGHPSDCVFYEEERPINFLLEMAQNTLTFGELRSCSQVTWGFSEPHTRTLWQLTFPLHRWKFNLSANPSSSTLSYIS
jgi:hypothetical protein